MVTRVRTPSSKQHQARPRATPKRTPADAPSSAQAAPLGEPATRVLRQFRLVFNTVKTHFQQVEKKAGVGGAQLWALGVISAQPGLGMGDLARQMDIHPSTASNLVRALVQQGLVRTAKDGPDRRAVQLHLCAAGKAVLRRAPGPFTGVLPQALASLEAPLLKRLEADLAALIAVLGVDARSAGIPLGLSQDPRPARSRARSDQRDG